MAGSGVGRDRGRWHRKVGAGLGNETGRGGVGSGESRVIATRVETGFSFEHGSWTDEIGADLTVVC